MNQSKRLAKTLCVMVTATSVTAQTLIFTEPVHIFAEPIATVAATEAIQEINISDLQAENEMITINLNKNGKYRIKGSNYINGAYVNTQILVPEGVSVDIYFAGASIDNPKLREVDYGCGKFGNESVIPLRVDGTANIHVEEDTKISGVDNLLTVAGTLNIMESKNNALLTFALGYDCPGDDPYKRMTNDSGTINIFNGNVLFNNLISGKKLNYSTKFHIMDGTIKFESIETEIEFSNDVIIDGGLIEGFECSEKQVYNSNGDPVTKHTFSGITPSTNIVQVGSYQQNSLVTDAEGKMNGIYVPKKDVVLYTEDKVYVYKYENESYSDTPTELNAYRVTLMLEDQVFDSYLVKENDTLTLPTNAALNYTFTANGEPFTDETKIIADTVIIMNQTTRMYDVTIDDTIYQARYGTVLKDCSGFQKGAIYQDQEGNLYFDDYVITCNIILTKDDLEFKYIDNKRFLKIATLQQLEEFAGFINSGHTNLNGILLADIEGDFTTPIGTDDNRYIGTFDGQGHSVNLAIESTDNYQGMFGVVSGGATIKNVVTTGTVKGIYACAGIVGGSKGSGNVTIDGCINKADVTGTHTDGAGIIATNTDSEATYSITNCGNQGHIVSKNCTSAMCSWSGCDTIIKNCYNVGKIENYSEDKSFIRGKSNITIDNCYQISTVKSQGNVTSKEETAFHSGEVTYLLNGDQSNIIWLQTCGSDYPMTYGDKTTQTVYYGYENDMATEKTYTNTRPYSGSDSQPSYTENTSESNVKSSVEYKQDGTIVITVVEVLEDGSTKKTETEVFKEGTRRTTVTIIMQDGSKTVTVVDIDGSSEYQKTYTEPTTRASVLITEKKDTKGEILSSKAVITVKGVKNSNKMKIPEMSSVINEIKQTTQSGHVNITYQVTDENSDSCYCVEVNSADLVSKNRLTVYAYDNKKQKYIPTNIKDIKVNKLNSISINLPMPENEEYSYKLVNTEDKEKINKDILDKIAPKKQKYNLQVKKKTTIKLVGLDMDTVAKIRYVSLDKKIATVDQKGNLVAKKKGKTVVKIAVRLKNNKTKS